MGKCKRSPVLAAVLWAGALAIPGPLCAQEKIAAENPDGFDCSRIVIVKGEFLSYYDRTTGRKLENPPILLLPSAHGQSPFSEGLCPAQRTPASYAGRKGNFPGKVRFDTRPPENQVGYVDMMGYFVVPPHYDDAEDFHEGRAVVWVAGKPGLIDSLGRWVVEPGKYRWIHPSHDGLCRFETHDRKEGFLDRDGNVVATYDGAFDFSEGLGRIADSKVQEAFIDTSGKIRFRLPREASAICFSQGLARVWFPTGTVDQWEHPQGLFGFVDTQGKVVVKAQFKSADHFSEGLAAVSLTDEEAFIGSNLDIDPKVTPDSRWGFIDVTGRVVIPMTFKKVGTFKEGLARFLDRGGWGYIDRQGNIAIPAQFGSAGDFCNGLAEAIIQDGDKVRFGYIDHTGKIVVKSDRGTLWGI